MTYLDFINLFNRYDREKRFSDGASRLYLKLLDVANEVNRSRPKGAPWIVDFQRSDGYVAGVYGCSVNTLKKHREELENRKLLSGDFGQSGRNSAGKYHLCYPEENMSKVDTIPEVNLSKVDTIAERNMSDVDIISTPNLSTSDTISPENLLNVSTNVSKVDTLYIEEENKHTSAAVAAGVEASFLEISSAESSTTKPAASTKKLKKNGAAPAEIATLALPHAEAEFANAWHTFTTDNTKQAGKPLTAFELMLKKLGRYPAGFAVVMLEAAIQGNWSGVENAGTARAFDEWQQQQARRPQLPAAPLARPSGPAPAVDPELNPAVVAQREAQRQAEADERARRFRDTQTTAAA